MILSRIEYSPVIAAGNFHSELYMKTYKEYFTNRVIVCKELDLKKDERIMYRNLSTKFNHFN